MRPSRARPVALGGMLTAAAVVVMCLGSMIPVNTDVCPMLCILLTRPILKLCGRKIALCYYVAVAILSLMLAPDREAALVYAFLGYYPLIQPWFEKLRPRAVRIAGKVLFFTLSAAAVYGLLMAVMGVEAVLDGSGPAAWALLGVAVVMWDLMLLMVDRLLTVGIRQLRRR